MKGWCSAAGFAIQLYSICLANPVEYKSELTGGSLKLSRHVQEGILMQHQLGSDKSGSTLADGGADGADLSSRLVSRIVQSGYESSVTPPVVEMIQSGVDSSLGQPSGVPNATVTNATKNQTNTSSNLTKNMTILPSPSPAPSSSPEPAMPWINDACEAAFAPFIDTVNSTECKLGLVELNKDFRQVNYGKACKNRCISEALGRFVNLVEEMEYATGHVQSPGDQPEICLNNALAPPMGDIAQQCMGSDDCDSPNAVACLNLYKAAQCPPSSPFRGCERYASCAYEEDVKRECHEFHIQETPLAAKVAITFELPLEMDPDDFRQRHSTTVVESVALSAGVSMNQVNILQVSKGSVVVSASITPASGQTLAAVMDTLEESMASSAFVNNLNQGFEGGIDLEAIKIIALASVQESPSNGTSVTRITMSGYSNRTIVQNLTPSPTTSLSPSPTPSPSEVVIAEAINYTITYECKDNCSGNGKCVNDDQCACNKGYGVIPTSAGEPLAQNPYPQCSNYTLSLCPDQCYGHGICDLSPLDTNDPAKCECFEGFLGFNCSRYSRCRHLNYCNGHGACTPSSHGAGATLEVCTCSEGYTGDACEQMHTACPYSCSGHGRCKVAQGRTCECDQGYAGIGCQLVTAPYCKSHCSGNGACTAVGTGPGNCTCVPGWMGRTCDVAYTTCASGCGHGYCRSGKCVCEKGYSGNNCEKYEPEEDDGCAALNHCHGYGLCNKTLTDAGQIVASCVCFEGFSGAHCGTVDVNYANQCPDHCSGHGTCQLISEPHCVCDKGWQGENCAASACGTQYNGRVCSGHGVCDVNSEGLGACACDPAYSNGALGECEVSACPDDCSGRGVCQANGTCACNAGFAGEACKTIVSAKKAAKAAVAANLVQKPKQELLCMHGTAVGGECRCKQGWQGVDCSRPAYVEEADDLDNMDFLEVEAATAPEVHAKMGALWD